MTGRFTAPRWLAVPLLAGLFLFGLPSAARTQGFDPDVEYTVVYLKLSEEQVTDLLSRPTVLGAGVLISGEKVLHAPEGCEPLTECWGTWKITPFVDVLNGMARKGWRLVSVQPVPPDHPLGGGFFAFMARSGLAPSGARR